MIDRETLIGHFLAAHGWAGADRWPLAGDASFRRYHRLTEDIPGKVRRAVLMDAPPPQEDVGPFARIGRHLRALGYSAPEILAEDRENGFLLLEDMGDGTYTRVIADGGDEHGLYALAVDLLIDLHRRPGGEAAPPGLPPYGNGRLLDEAFLLPQWTLPAFTGGPLPEEARRAYGRAWLEVFPRVHAQSYPGAKTLVLRDYHVDNLMWLPDRPGVGACGLLDFQDAVRGPGAYDLMSLLEDARRDIDGSLVKEMLDRYVAGFANMDRREFEAVFAILAAQRHAKVIGIFSRLCLRDGKPGYLAHIPRLWRLLEKALEHPALSAVRQWFDRHVPARQRQIPNVDNNRP